MSRKLYSLASCIEDVEPLFGSDNAPVDAIEGVGNHLILGSGNGTVVSIALIEDPHSNERIFVENTAILPQGRPVVQLKAFSALNRILALSDGSLFVLTLDSLKVIGAPRMRSVSCMALNECPNTDAPLAIQMAVGLRRRQIAVCEFQNDRINTMLELDTDDIALTLAYDDQCICYATSSHYYIIDLQKRQTRPLFPMKSEDAQPIVRRIAKNEFLLTGLHNLGMFVTSDGVSNRQPISWDDESPVATAFCHPYAIVLSKSFLSVFSIVDQELKQKIPFSGGQCVCECEGELFVASRRRVYQLKPVHWERQVDALLASNMADEALEVARNAQKYGSKEEYLQRFKRIQQRCGFVKMATGDWNETRDLLLQSRGDVREVVSLYPGLLPTSSTFVRAVPPLHNMADISSAAPANNCADWRLESEKFLFEFLGVCRSEQWTSQWKKEIDSALLKLASEFDQDLFVSILTTAIPASDVLEDLQSWLSVRKRHHASALLDWFNGKSMEALKMWDKLWNKEIADDTFPGTASFLGDLLLHCQSITLVTDGCDLLLKYDENAAIKVLINAPAMKDVGLDVIEKLLDGRNSAFLGYMEERVRVDADANLQTRLGLLFIASLSKESGEEIRKRFRIFVCAMENYDTNVLLRRLEVDPTLDGTLLQEKAVLLGRLGSHDKALDIIISQCNDLTFADEYCQLFSAGKDRKSRHALYSNLLKSLFVAQEKNKVLVAPIMRLLNNEHVNVDLASLLAQIPDHWSLDSLKPFLMKNTSTHASAMNSGAIGAGLVKRRNQCVTVEMKDAGNQACRILENSRCGACDQLFLEPNCVRYPNGTLIHNYCLRHPQLCPATQQVFCISQTK